MDVGRINRVAALMGFSTVHNKKMYGHFVGTKNVAVIMR